MSFRYREISSAAPAAGNLQIICTGKNLQYIFLLFVLVFSLSWRRTWRSRTHVASITCTPCREWSVALWGPSLPQLHPNQFMARKGEWEGILLSNRINETPNQSTVQTVFWSEVTALCFYLLEVWSTPLTLRESIKTWRPQNRVATRLQASAWPSASVSEEASLLVKKHTGHLNTVGKKTKSQHFAQKPVKPVCFCVMCWDAEFMCMLFRLYLEITYLGRCCRWQLFWWWALLGGET